MIDYLGMVREFHNKYNHYTSAVPHIPPENIVNLRQKLITEEAAEFEEHSEDAFNSANLLNEDRERDQDVDIVINLADDLADILYVVFGAALAYGIPIEAAFMEIHRSNMTKSMAKDEKTVKGKTIKGPDYDPPDIRHLIDIPSFGEE